ncbi:hypothetical protein CA85_43930 [Allorhodopirellula solitaria]|uniref:Uncharacterized protein n=1 Tax=Allorhodopirellula solitaria TaxID=2527987 RepID=A0A5C5X1M8_9BACT|nr:hypothetical protein CA85_43930 [Allorhodopirellula solitaria]
MLAACERIIACMWLIAGVMLSSVRRWLSQNIRWCLQVYTLEQQRANDLEAPDRRLGDRKLGDTDTGRRCTLESVLSLVHWFI